MKEFKENAIEWLNGEKEITLTLNQRKFINKIRNLAERNPEEVRIEAENLDGSIVAVLPLSYLRFVKPRIFTEEEKKASSERFRKLREEGFYDMTDTEEDEDEENEEDMED